MHGKFHSEMKRCGMKRLVFIACDVLLIMKINDEVNKTFTYACIKNSVFDGINQLVATKLTSQQFFFLGSLHHGSM